MSGFEFLIHEPQGELRRFVEAVWFARGRSPTAREQIAPTGSTVAGIVLADPILQTAARATVPYRAETGFLIGPHDRPMVNQPLGLTHCYGIVVTPVGCRAVFGCKPAPLRGRVVDLVEEWPEAGRLRSALAAIGDGASGLELLRAALARLPLHPEPGMERAEVVVESLTRDPAVSIAALADGLGISHGHLDRQFTRVVGLNPRTLARILRVRRLLERLDVAGQVDWSNLAAQHGWFDQAHLIRDFRRHTGVTPSAYVRAQRAVYSPEDLASSAGFTPER